MALYTVSNGNTANAADLNQIINVLQQPTGGTETGKYVLGGSPYTSNAVISTNINTLSRNATPVSVSIDTSAQAPAGGMGTVSTGFLTSSGLQIYCLNATGPSTNARASGNFTVQY